MFAFVCFCLFCLFCFVLVCFVLFCFALLCICCSVSAWRSGVGWGCNVSFVQVLGGAFALSLCSFLIAFSSTLCLLFGIAVYVEEADFKSSLLQAGSIGIGISAPDG